MRLDDHICYCYHVSLRKLVNYARRERIQRPSQLSDCLGAGTGCGWCIPILKKIHEMTSDGRPFAESGPVEGLPDSPEAYARARADYRQTGEKNTFEP